LNVDYIHDYYYDNKLLSIQDITIFSEKSEIHYGDISIIPAGDTSSTKYLQKLSTINWDSILYEPENQGSLFFLELKEKIKRQLKPDFLLIDSRTGITEIGGICTTLLADKIVFMLTNNEENFEGTKLIYNNTKKNIKILKKDEIQSVFALTRIPFTEDQTVETLIKKKFQERLGLESLPFVIHSNRELELKENIAIQLMAKEKNEPILINDYLQLTLANLYFPLGKIYLKVYQ